MEQNKEQGAQNRLPYIVFEVAGRAYAVNSQRVVSIAKLGEVSRVRPTKPHIRGTTEWQGNRVRLVDLRALFGAGLIKDEQAALIKQFSDIKKGHQNWAKALEKSARDMTPFTLTTDPAQCLLGKWKESFSTDNHEITLMLQKIDRPHKAFHAAGVTVQKALERSDSKAALAAVEQVNEEYSVEIAALLDQILQMYKDSLVEMVITLQEGETTAGIIVDKVKGVYPLEQMADRTVLDRVHPCSFVAGVARSQSINGLIILLEDEGLFEQAAN